MKERVGYIFILFLILVSSTIQSKEIEFMYQRCSISRNNLVSSSQFLWDGPSLSKNWIQVPYRPDSLHVLALLVEFQVDQNDSTTGVGAFQMTAPTEAVLDPPPHDRNYFQSHLQALSHYYKTVSHGKLILLTEVFEEILTLQHTMGYYNPATTEEATDEGLAKLFHDAVVAGDNSGVRFSNYNCLIIFHAGVGKDINLGYDPTPQDIPSAFLGLDDLQKYLAPDDPDYQGISVENSQRVISEGILLPETQSQEGYEIGLLGTMTLMFGFQLGLPALWNTQTGQSGVGAWGLMDQGSGNFSGLIPAQPCAFSKVFLGWEEPIEIRDGVDFIVACSQAVHSNKIYKLPINDHEYFLIENRIHDFNHDGFTRGVDDTNQPIIFDSLGLTEPQGVIVEVDEYDFGLPGSGVLIWHVDEDVIQQNLAENRINANPEQRGVDLEEADGAQDIGESYDFLSAGSGAENGVMHDAWYQDNEIHMLANQSQTVAFTPISFPNTHSNEGSNSEITVTDFSTIDSLMTFSVFRGRMRTGFPVDFGIRHTPFQPEFGDLDGDGFLDIVIATRNRFVFAWDRNGEALVENPLEGIRISVGGDTTFLQLPVFGDAVDSITVEPVVGDLDGDDLDEVVVGTASLSAKIFPQETAPPPDSTIDNSRPGPYCDSKMLCREGISALLLSGSRIILGNHDGLVRVLRSQYGTEIYQTLFPYGGIEGISLLENRDMVITTDLGNVFCIDSDGQFKWIESLLSTSGLYAPGAGFLSSTNESVFTFAESGEGFQLNREGDLQTFAVHPDQMLKASDPALGDLDGDGLLEIVITAGSQVWAYKHNGSVVDNFPMPNSEIDLTLSSPVLGDIDGNGSMDVLVATTAGQIEAWSVDGEEVDGFPLSTGGKEPIPPALVDLDGDGQIELVAVSDQGYLFAWDFDGTYSEATVPWGQHFHDSYHTGVNPQLPNPDQPAENWMPNNFVYNYPNPTEGDFTTIRYRLEVPAEVKIRIFNLAGVLVDQLTGSGDGLTENEVIWNLNNVDAGVYFCEVKAKSELGEKSAICKIAVVK